MSEKHIKVPPPDPYEERLYSAAEKYREELIKITCDLVAIESVTYDPERYCNLQPIFDYVADYLEKIGFRYRYFYCPHLKDPDNRDELWPNLIAFYAPDSVEKYIDLPDDPYSDDKNSDVKIPDIRPFLQFNGHLDTVPFIAEKWSEGFHPLEPKVVAKRIYGRGSFDMKGGVACILVAARIFAENIKDPYGKLQLWFVPDEEINGNYGADFMSSQFREVVNADGTVITEPTAQSPLKSPAIIVGEKGIRWLRFRVFGAAGHGSVPKPKSNAINKALRFLAEINKWKLPKVKPPLKKKDMLKFLLGRYSLRSLLSIVKQKEERKNIYDEDGASLSAFFKTTVSFTKFKAGTKVNVIPDIAEFELDIRVLPGVTEQMLFDSLARYCTKLGYRLKLPEGYSNPQENNPKIMARPVDIEVSVIGSTIGTYENPDSPFMRTLGDVFESVYGVKRIYFFATGSTDAVHMRKNGIKNIAVFGPGGKNAHDADEYVEIDHLVKVTKVLTGLAYRMLKHPNGSTGSK